MTFSARKKKKLLKEKKEKFFELFLMMCPIRVERIEQFSLALGRRPRYCGYVGSRYVDTL